MSQESEEVVDLSVWIGAPPSRPKVPDVAASSSGEEGEDVEEGEDLTASKDVDGLEYVREGDGRPSKRSMQSCSATSESISCSSVSRRSWESDQHNGARQTFSPAYSDRYSSRVCINVPDLSNGDAYKHLPGYFTVDKIVKEVAPDLYLVKLKSGEIDLLSTARLRDYSKSSNALRRFHSSSMAPRTRRKAIRPQAEGFVDWSTLDLQDSDEAISREVRQRPQRRAKQDSDASAESEHESRSPSHEEEFDSDNPPPIGRRSLRLKSSVVKTYIDKFNAGDLGDDFSVARASSQRRARRARRGRPSANSRERSVSYAPTTARRSDRTRTQPHRSMRERQEDEISVHSEEEAGPRILAAKEYFEKLPIDDSFRRRHTGWCDICNIDGDSDLKGTLVFCQGCTGSYHKTCLGSRGTREHLVTKIAERRFVLQCRHCLGVTRKKDVRAPHRGSCSGCKELGPAARPFRAPLTTREEQAHREAHGGVDPITEVDPRLINSTTNVMFRCINCQRAWHMHHLPRRDQAQPVDDEEEPHDEGTLADLRFDYYSHSWTCKDCLDHNSQLDAMVAWRPVDLESYIPGSTLDMVEEIDKEYLIKWKAQSYFRTTWMPGAWVCGVAAVAMRAAFAKKIENELPKMTTEDAIPEDWLRVDIVFDVIYTSVVSNRTKEIDFARAKEVDSAYVKYRGLGYEDAIWEKPPSYEEKERWADFKLAYEDWVLKHYVHTPSQPSLRRHIQAVKSKNFDSQLVKKTQPSLLTGGELMDYQLLGMNWLYYQWYKSQNCVLADEMGLGKTIQVIAYFALMVQDHKCWPFLVVVPNSTCPNWRREIKQWAPSLRAVTYYGSSVARKLTQDYELFPKDDEEKERSNRGTHERGQPKDVRAHIVITSYESVVEPKAHQNLQKVSWAGLVVDEGQRLKNEKNLLYENLSKMKFPFKFLLTGTPLQNSARELFNLLQFLDTKISASEMEAEYTKLTNEKVAELHEKIRPFFLRRTKAQVLTFLPPLSQIILPVTMSVVQKKLYKSILAKNPQLMKSIFSRQGNVGQKEKVNLNNILMQLRKTLCHPFVYNRDIEERSYEPVVAHRNLVGASTKLQLLELMLPKLRERGHRVLLFSQFLENLDIVEDFLDGLGLLHRRLDGDISSLEKQKRIDEFNAPGSPYFAFLLSTRAGGVGINLASADTVIIMDPDFNPHQDIQALSRVHRIGQKNKVLVFQMMTRGSAEEKIMQMGKKKMALDHVLIQKMDQEDETGVGTESILRHGADALFKDDSTDDIIYDSTSVDKLLDRSQIEITQTGEDKSAESQFGFARVWANDRALLEDNPQESEVSTPAATDTTVWDKILQERERIYAAEESARAETLGRGKRKRNNVDYQVTDAADVEIKPSPVQARHQGSDTDFEANGSVSDVGDESSGPEDTPLDSDEADGLLSKSPKQPKVKARPFRRVELPSGNPPYGDEDLTSKYTSAGASLTDRLCAACGQRHPMGWCRLKLAGVEHCGLCGIAHRGYGRTCPHLNSETHVATMLGTLKESTESAQVVEEARKYLRIIRGDLQRRRAQERKEWQLAQATARPQHQTQRDSRYLHESRNQHPHPLAPHASRQPSQPPPPPPLHSHLIESNNLQWDTTYSEAHSHPTRSPYPPMSRAPTQNGSCQ